MHTFSCSDAASDAFTQQRCPCEWHFTHVVLADSYKQNAWNVVGEDGPSTVLLTSVPAVCNNAHGNALRMCK